MNLIRLAYTIKANKGIGWMPWHQAPKKDVTSCDKLRGAANKPRSADFRMGKPTDGNASVSPYEHIVRKRGTRGTETSHYPEEKKVNQRFRK